MSKILDRIINYIGMYGVFKSTTDDSVTLSGPLKLENNTGIYSKDAYGDYQQLLNWDDSDIINLGPVSLTNGRLTNITTVSNNTDAVNKQYVDNRTVDYVESQGTSGMWTYRKWNSGIAECWGRKTWSSVVVTSGWGSDYSANLSSLSAVSDYPFAFKTVPVSQITDSTTSGRGWIIRNTGDSTTSIGTLYVISPTQYTSTNPITSVVANFYVIGKWK